MHHLYLVLLPEASARGPREAIDAAKAFLSDEGFCAPDGFYSYGRCDWFSIGGRWSGLFSRLTWAKDAVKAINALEAERNVKVYGVVYPLDSELTDVQAKVQVDAERIWSEAAAAAGVPLKAEGWEREATYVRDAHFTGEPYPDDAVKLTPELLDALRKEYDGQGVECIVTSEMSEYDVSELPDGSTGWLVIVDYHD